MAVFSRRTLQRLINENTRFLRRKQSRDHIKKLNRNDESFLDTEWEVVLLNAFSKLGNIIHEPKFEKGGTPDIFFTSKIDPNQTFLADIATVSNKGLDDKYPIKALYDRLIEILLERGFKPNSFHLRVEGEIEKFYQYRPKVNHKFPKDKNQFDKLIFNDKFYEFLNEVHRSAYEPLSYWIKDEQTDVLITYSPNQSFSGMTHLSYDLIDSLVHNTIYYRLAEKADKVINTNYKGSLAVILCDGGCSRLSRRREWDTYGITDVIKYFFSQYPQISFALIFSVEQQFGFDAHSKVTYKLFEGESFNSVGKDILGCISRLSEVFPQPERNAVNAIHLINAARPNEGDTFYGEYTVSSDEIEISARALLDLLSGRITQENFFLVHHFTSIEGELTPSINPFSVKLGQGRLITEIKVKTEPERDDNWLIIKFGDPDPAISPFTLPPDNDSIKSERDTIKKEKQMK